MNYTEVEQPFNPEVKKEVQAPEFETIFNLLREENRHLENLTATLQDIVEKIKPISHPDAKENTETSNENGLTDKFRNQIIYFSNSNNNLSMLISHLKEIF